MSPDELDKRLRMAEAIQAARKAVGLTLEALARKLGESAATVRSWERRKPPPHVPRVDAAQALAAALNTTLGALHIGEQDAVVNLAAWRAARSGGDPAAVPHNVQQLAQMIRDPQGDGVAILPPPKDSVFWILTPDQCDEFALVLVRLAERMRQPEK